MRRGHFIYSTAVATSLCSPQSAAPHRAFASSPFGLQNLSVELFHERAGCLQIRKTPPKIDLAFSNNSPSIPCLNFSRPVKVHHPATHFDIQFIVGDDKFDDVGIPLLVCDCFSAKWLAHYLTPAQ
jgi:hypothetical protein